MISMRSKSMPSKLNTLVDDRPHPDKRAEDTLCLDEEDSDGAASVETVIAEEDAAPFSPARAASPRSVRSPGGSKVYIGFVGASTSTAASEPSTPPPARLNKRSLSSSAVDEDSQLKIFCMKSLVVCANCKKRCVNIVLADDGDTFCSGECMWSKEFRMQSIMGERTPMGIDI